MRWLVLALLLLIAAPAQATVLWFSGCEAGSTGNPSEFIGNGTSGLTGMSCNTTCGGTSPKTGNYCLAVGTSTFGASSIDGLAGLGLTTIYSRFYFNWHSLGGNFPIWAAFKAASANSVRLQILSASQKLAFSHDDQTILVTGTKVLSVDTWYLIEVQGVISATVGGIVVSIDGVQDFSTLSTNTSDITAFDSVNFGWSFGLGSSQTAGWDDMMVCSGSACPTGHSIARQGTSGSPTYTAWTKNSCTSSLIENCWSETPFGTTTPSASSTVVNDAQTMIVYDFATAQTGHGTETIGNTSTINACKTSMVANAGSGGTLTMRRRISGSDTDTAKTMTTSNLYFDDGIWTTTAGVLGNSANMEIGAKQGANAVTQTVRDMWLMCDYTNASVAPKHRVIQQ